MTEHTVEISKGKGKTMTVKVEYKGRRARSTAKLPTLSELHGSVKCAVTENAESIFKKP